MISLQIKMARVLVIVGSVLIFWGQPLVMINFLLKEFQFDFLYQKYIVFAKQY